MKKKLQILSLLFLQTFFIKDMNAQNVLDLLNANTSQTSAMAYSVRRVCSQYTGPAIKVRRSSDDATQTIGFDRNGFLDTASLKTFVGGGCGFVEIWYDQSGNGRNASQTTTNLQPRIVLYGAVERTNDRPAINFATAGARLLTTPGIFFPAPGGASMVAVAESNSISGSCDLVSKTNLTNTPSTQYAACPFDYSSNGLLTIGNASASSNVSVSINLVPASAVQLRGDVNKNVNASVYSFIAPSTSGQSINAYLNGALVGSVTQTAIAYNDANTPLVIGNRFNGSNTAFDFKSSEILLFNSVSVNRAMIEESEKNYFQIERETKYQTTSTFSFSPVSPKGYVELWGSGSYFGGAGAYAKSYPMNFNASTNYQVSMTSTTTYGTLPVNTVFRLLGSSTAICYASSAINSLGAFLSPSTYAPISYSGGNGVHLSGNDMKGGAGAGRFNDGMNATTTVGIGTNGGGTGGQWVAPSAIASVTPGAGGFWGYNGVVYSADAGEGLAIVHYTCPSAGIIETSHTIPWPIEKNELIANIIGDIGNGLTYSWQQSDDGVTWTSAPSSIPNNPNFVIDTTATNLSTWTTKYLRRVSNTCATPQNSNVVKLRVFTANNTLLNGSVSGKVSTTGGVGVAGITIKVQKTISLYGSPQSYVYTTQTGPTGLYTIPNIFYGDNTNGDPAIVGFTIKVSKPGHTFSYDSLNVSMSNGSHVLINQDFTDLTAYGISGRTFQKCIGCLNAAGVSVNVEKNLDSVKMYKNNLLFGTTGIIDSVHGRYSTSVSDPGNYTIKPLYKNHSFTPATQVLNVTADTTFDFQDASNFTISGTLTAGNNEIIGSAILEFSDMDSTGAFTFRKQATSSATTGFYSITLPAGKYVAKVLSFTSNMPFSNPLYIDSIALKNFINNLPKDSLLADIDTMNRTLNITYHRPPVLDIVGLTNYTCTTSNPPISGKIFKQNVKDSFIVNVYEGPVSLNNKIVTSASTPEDTITVYTSVEDDEANTPEDKFFKLTNGSAKVKLIPGVPNLVSPYKKILIVRYKDKYGRMASDLIKDVYVTGIKTDAQFYTTVSPQVPFLILHAPPGDQSVSEWKTTKTFQDAMRLYVKKADSKSLGFEVNVGASFSAGFGVEINTEVTASLNSNISTTISNSDTRELIFTKSTTQTYSTVPSSDYGVSGDLADLFIGSAINFKYGKTYELNLNSCGMGIKTGLMVAPNGFQTDFVLTGYDITNTTIPSLQAIANLSSGNVRKNYLNQISLWQQILNNNRKNKEVAKFEQNITFGSGSSQTSSVTNSASIENSMDFEMNIDNSIATELGFEINGTGVGGSASVTFSVETGKSRTITNLEETTTSTTLQDNSLGDQFTVDVKKDPVYNTPVFKTISGLSSCPPEENTQSRDKCELYIPVPNQTVSSGDTATFILYLNNLSESGETRSYNLSFDNASNTLGVGLMVGVNPFNVPLSYTIPPFGSVPVFVKVIRPSGSNYSFEGLKFVLSDQCASTTSKVSSTGTINAYFASSCSGITLNTPQDNQSYNLTDNNIVPISFNGYNTSLVTNVSLQYARKNSNSWLTGFTIPASSLTPSSTNVNWLIDTIADGNYKVRLNLTCTNGGNFYTPSKSILIDRTSPSIFGIPSPTNHKYNLGDEISISYDESVDNSNLNTNKVVMTLLSNNSILPISVSAADNQIMIVPTINLLQFPNDSVRVVVNNISDLNGNVKTIPDTFYFVINPSTPILGLDSVQVFSTNLSKFENAGGTIDIHFKPSHSSASNRTINYTISGNAQFGTDYTVSYDSVKYYNASTFNGMQGSVVVFATESETIMRIQTNADSDWEPNDSIRISLSYGGDYQIPSDSNFVVAIIKNDDVLLTANKTKLCLNDTVTLTANANANSNINWSTGANTPTIKVTTPGTYSFVAVTPGLSNITSNSITITADLLHTAPTPVISASGPTTLCQNQSVNLSTGTYASYQWSNGDSINSISVNTAGIYTVTVTDNNACIGTATKSIIVNPIPEPDIIANGPTSFCAGGNVTLSVGSFSNYLWSTGATTPSITVSSTGTYSVTVTNSYGCTAMTSINVISVPNPSPVITVTGPTTVCQGTKVALNAGTWTAYSWSDGTSKAIDSVSTTGTYTVTVVNGLGCIGTATKSVIVDTVAKPTITASGSTTICQGQTVTLSANGGYGNYLWSTGATTQSIIVNQAGVYTVSVSNGTCPPFASSSVSITVKPIPSPNIIPNGPLEFCQGGNVNLSVAPNTGLVSYTWSNGLTTPTIDASTSGTYTVNVVDVNGCSATSAGVVVNSKPIPVIIVSGSTNYCQGDNIVLSAGTWPSYTWSNGSTSPTISVTSTGTYSVTVGGTNGCDSSASKSIVLKPQPIAQIVTTGTTSLCRGDSVGLSVQNLGNACQLSNSLYLEVPHSSSLAMTNQLTLETWVNLSSLNQQHSLIEKYTSGSSFGYALRITANNKLLGSVMNGSSVTTFIEGNTQLSANNWYHVAMTYNRVNGLVKVYVNGILDGVICITGLSTTPSVGTLKLGASGDNHLNNLIGKMDEARVWNVERSQSELAANMNTTIDGTTSGLVGYYGMDEGSGNVANDLSGKGNSASLIGTSAWQVPSTAPVTRAGIVNYAWSNGSTQPSIYAKTNGSYSASIIDTNGCTASSVLVPVTVNPMPVITASGSTTFCESGSVSLNAGTYSSYSWNTGASTSSIIVSTNGTYTATVVNANGCIDSATQKVVVYQKPDPIITGPAYVCTGNTANLTSTVGSSMQFDGVDDYVDVGTSLGNFTGDYTVEFWFKTTDADAAIITKRVACGAENLLNFRLIAGKINFEVYKTSSAGTFNLVSPTTLNNNVWHHVAGVVTNSNKKLYIDGVMVASTTLTGNGISNTTSLNFGSGPCEIYNGLLDEVKLWSVARTQSEIQSTMNVETAANSTGLVGYFKFEEGTGTSTINSVTNSDQGQLINGPIWQTSSTAPLTYANYVWTPGSSSSSTASINAAGTYSVTVTDINGCSATSPGFSIASKQSPTPYITANGPTTFCSGGSVNLGASGSSSLQFDGVDDYVDVGTSLGNFTGDYTIEFWFKSTDADGVIMGKRILCGFEVLLNFRLTSGKILFEVNKQAAGGTFSLTSPTVLNNGAWHHVAGTVSNSIKRLYIDGVVVATSTIVGTGFSNTTNLKFGSGPCGNYSGLLDEVRLWSVARSTVDIQSNMNSSVPVNSTSLVGYFKMDEGIGNTTVNAVTGVTTGTLVNGPVWQSPSTTPFTTYYTNFVWTPGGATTPTISANATGTYSVTVTDNNGCTGTSQGVLVNAVSSPVIIANGPTSFCTGGSVALSVDTNLIEKRFASSVIGFSSQFGVNEGSANQVLGAPNVYPLYGNLPNAWASLNANNSREYLHLGFSNPSPINFIEIYETFNPGAIDTVYVKNPNTGLFEIVYTHVAVPVAQTSRILHITFPTTSFAVSEIRIAINSGAVSTWNEIDAVSIGKSPTILWSNGSNASSIQVDTSGTYNYTLTFTGGCTKTSNTVNTSELPCTSSLELKLFIQGYYAGGGLMEPVLSNQGIGSSTSVTDSIMVKLHSDTSPYNVVASQYAILNTDGIALCNFPIPLNGNYYVEVLHRNGLQTWSALAIPFTSLITSYDFTTAANKAFGSNQVEVSPGVFAFYSGDLNSDENIDLLDQSLLENDINDFMFGYINSDLNGDGNVDLLDNPILETNLNNFIYSIHP